MFIIFGSPRSGTTLLASTISLHSQVLVLDQTDFIVPWALIVERIQGAQNQSKQMTIAAVQGRYWANSLGAYIDEQEVNKIVSINTGHFVNTLQSLYSHLGDKVGKELVGDKSVSDISFFPVLNRVGLFDGEVKIVHIVRDVRDALVSLERLDWIKDREIYPRSWGHSNLGLSDLLTGKPFYYFLRYEDFVASPQFYLDTIFDFLEVDREDVLSISPTKRGRIYVGQVHHENLQKPITTSGIGVWKKRLNKKLATLSEEQASEALCRFGYK